ncbi:septum formation initiator family protein [Actinocrinis puniceicyclus]|uniref:Septum formation initiator family protein n=1 Tax=Actinocrinis puniceicyclus TaxID=977794 RepID=A0A8J8BA28_9ACTN|nr:septum formation initiator family protein [Actinocrinis puniceicyclus]MBS2962497.1 septum formation initiator family protein [Actinocrinis puniceicyclus]
MADSRSAKAGKATENGGGVSGPAARIAALPRQRPGSGGPPRKPSRNRLTGRVGILALALCAVMVTVAYPLRQYLAQRTQIAGLRHQNDVTAQQVATLQRELDKWSDPAYVAIQARERLHYVRPGEIGYIVPNPSAAAEPLGIPTPTEKAWYDRLWSTVKTPSPVPSPSQTR